MKPGKIAIAALQQSDKKYKKRPVLILNIIPPYNDVLVCGISSTLHNYQKDQDYLLDSNHPDFKISGLKNDSIIKVLYLATIPIHSIEGSIGEISSEIYQVILKLLIQYLSDSII